jgi:hypothetical protein
VAGEPMTERFQRHVSCTLRSVRVFLGVDLAGVADAVVEGTGVGGVGAEDRASEGVGERGWLLVGGAVGYSGGGVEEGGEEERKEERNANGEERCMSVGYC